jgi:NAD(P)-dependent dehydrogenase (short-subunit alcohol dehydrogenase family)
VDVAGTAAIVTGGASGLGLATARRLRDAGARVLVIDLPGHGTEDEFDLSFTTADVTDPVQLEGAIARATELGPLRTLVTCAGIAPGDRAVKRNGPLPLDDFARVIHLNLIGTFNAIRLAAAAMMVETESDGERGVIVTTSSVAAFDGQIGQSAYAASKAGVAGMTLPLAREFAASLIRGAARRDQGVARRADAAPDATGIPGGVCCPGAARAAEPDDQWRDDPARRGDADGATLVRGTAAQAR